MITILSTLLLLSMLMALHTATEAPRVVRMQISKFKGNRLGKRDPRSVILGNAVSEGFYYVNAAVGTPPQNVALQIDTGSSDVWMFGPGSCDTKASHCLGGTFDLSQSTTITELVPDFNIRYVTPGSGVVGTYIADNFAIGDMIVQNLTMAVATSARYVDTGIMGIGFDTDESLLPGQKPYLNIIDDMVTQGFVKTRAYSLWLDDLNADTGTILFGGYDNEKYNGDLVALPIQPDLISGIVNTMSVAWTSFSIRSSQGNMVLTSADFAAPAVLDSGTSYIALPMALFNKTAAWFGAINDENYGYLVYCNLSRYDGTLEFGFGGPTGQVISVKYAELAIPIYFPNGTQLTFSDGTYACSFGMFPVSDGEQILFGDTFLRSAYVVYDLDNKEIALAPTKFGSTRSNIIEIPQGGGNGASVAERVSVPQTAAITPARAFMGAATATGALVTAVPLFGGLGRLTATEAQPTNEISHGTTSAMSTHSSQSIAATFSVANSALLVVVAWSVAMEILGGLAVDMA